jgi:serine/threonine protein phosphatase 1
VLAGNHETAMVAFLDNPRRGAAWLDMGGRETLASYGVPLQVSHSRESRTRLAQSAQASIPAEHVAFLRGLPVSLSWRNYLFVHAGIRPGIPLEQQTDRELLEIREEFIHSNADHGRIIVHGHTPSTWPQRHHNRIAVDTAAYATGRLAAVKLADGALEFFVAGRAGRIAFHPAGDSAIN